MKSGYYWTRVGDLKRELLREISPSELRHFHRRRTARHISYAIRQFAIVAGCSVALWSLRDPLYWVPVAVLLGFTFFNMTTLLHEVVHQTVFRSPRPRWERFLGLAYAITSGISATQFTRWHLDHHDNLGSAEDDPKRHWFSPRVNARWYKLLYCTPWLMPLYFRAAAREARSYPAELRKRIRSERVVTMAIQFSVMVSLFTLGGIGPVVRIHLVPYFVVFPIAFTLNRLGQHYNIDPGNPLKWATLMKASRLWDFLFLYSNYHLEHHYFPRVPFYNLRDLHFRLQPLYRRLDLKPHTYRDIAWAWFVLNRPPHADWDALSRPSAPNPQGLPRAQHG